MALYSLLDLGWRDGTLLVWACFWVAWFLGSSRRRCGVRVSVGLARMRCLVGGVVCGAVMSVGGGRSKTLSIGVHISWPYTYYKCYKYL